MKKTLAIAKKVFTMCVIVMTVCIMIFTIFSVIALNGNDKFVFNHRALIVLSDSMSESGIDAGDLILIKKVDPSTLKEGDIISYISLNPDNYGDTVTHMIRTCTEDTSGNPGFITYGTSTKVNDPTIVTYNYVVGVHTKTFDNVGSFFMFLKTTPGYFLCIFTPFALLIGIQAINTIQLFSKYKKEQLAEMEEKQRKDEEEKERMREELKQLKEQLGIDAHLEE